MSLILVSLSASTKPLLFLLYPRLSTATLLLLLSNLIRYSTCGVLPEPPTVMLPTEITGMSKLRLFNMPSSNNWLRSLTPRPYSQLNGSIHSLIFIKSPSMSSVAGLAGLVLFDVQFKWYPCLYCRLVVDVLHQHERLVIFAECLSGLCIDV